MSQYPLIGLRRSPSPECSNNKMKFENYVGLPWREMGRDVSGVDCWGLVYLFYKNELGIELPTYSDVGHGVDHMDTLAIKIHQRMNNWLELKKPQPGDCVLINIFGRPTHIGIVVDKSSMLHVSQNADSVIEKFTSPKWSNRIEGFYTYVDG